MKCSEYQNPPIIISIGATYEIWEFYPYNRKREIESNILINQDPDISEARGLFGADLLYYKKHSSIMNLELIYGMIL